ncbi:DUF4755 domain-containing protein [Luteimonas sp. A537]
MPATTGTRPLDKDLVQIINSVNTVPVTRGTSKENSMDDSTAAFFTLTLGAGFGAVIFGLLASWRHKPVGRWVILGAVCGVIPLIGWLVGFGFLLDLLFGTKGDSGSETSTAAKAFGQGAQYVYVADNTGIAVDPGQETVRLKNGSTIQTYPFSAVRGWKTNLASGGEIIGGTGYTAIAAGGANLRNERENRKNSGLFVSVRDIDNPEWRIDMPNENNQKRWMEIMRQSINRD